MPPIILGSLLLAALLLLSAGLGRRILRWLGLPDKDSTATLLLSLGVGLGALQFVPFALLAVGAAKPLVIRCVLGALFLLLIPDISASVRSATQSIRSLGRWPAWEKAIGCFFLLFLAAVFLRALCPITDDDGLSYHLPAALRLLDAGRFIYLPTLTYTNWPLGVESLFLLLLGVHPGAPVGIVQFAFACLILAAVWSLGRRIGGPAAGAMAAIVLLLYRTFWEEATQAHVDVGTALYATLAVYAIHMGLRSAERSAWLRAGVLLAGFASATKLLGVWAIFATAVVVLLSHREETSDRKQRLREAIGVAALGLLCVAPWLARTWVVTGNPLYPMFFRVFGGREWTAEGWPRIQHYFLLMNTPPGLAPTQANLLLGRIGLVGLALVVSVIIWRATRNSPLAAPARFAAFFTVGALLGSGFNLRFLMAAYPSVCLCAGVGLARVRRAPTLAVVLCVLLGASSLRSQLRAGLPTALSVALGTMGRDAYLRSALADYPIVEYANANLPRDSVILVGTWEEENAYYRPLALRANYWLQDSVHYDSPQRLDADLARLGVTHLVLSPMDPQWCSKSSVCHGRDLHETRALFELAARRGEKLFQANDITLYRVK